MQRQAFIDWLTSQRYQQSSSAQARAGNCATIEVAYGDGLDTLNPDTFAERLEEFRYPRAHARAKLPVRHRVRINGDQYTGTASLRSALRLYYDFRFHPGAGRILPQAAPGHVPTRAAGDWARWESPSDEDSLLLAKVLTRHARFIDPQIVRAIMEDNHRHAAGWRAGLRSRGIPADAYLWEGSPCAFPGVRRYAGSDENAIYRGRKQSDGGSPKDALALDDNDYPKHLWSFLFRGKPFQKQGPQGYNLAHLADHKNHKNRAANDFELAQGPSAGGRLYGLYTCPMNTVFLPAGLLKPTDFHSKVRGLFIRRAQTLYGRFCRIVPPHLEVPECRDARWGIDRFDWAEPVGEAAHLTRFLQFREARVKALLAQNGPRSIDPTRAA